MIQDKYIIWGIIVLILLFALYKNKNLNKNDEHLSNLFEKEIQKKPINLINKKNKEKTDFDNNDMSDKSIETNESSIRYTYIYDKIDYTNYDGYRNDEFNRDRKRQVRFNLDNNTFH
jgi:hypothetical protein